MTYEPGQLVLKKTIPSDKLEDPWTGPFEIIRRVDNNRIVIKEKGKESIQNIKNIIPFFWKGGGGAGCGILVSRTTIHNKSN